MKWFIRCISLFFLRYIWITKDSSKFDSWRKKFIFLRLQLNFILSCQKVTLNEFGVIFDPQLKNLKYTLRNIKMFFFFFYWNIKELYPLSFNATVTNILEAYFT